MKRRILRPLAAFSAVLLIFAAAGFAYLYFKGGLSETLAERKTFRSLSDRLKAGPRYADLLITDVSFDENAGKLRTGVKFTEYDHNGKPLEPRYFTCDGNIIQLQSMRIRLDNLDIENPRSFRNKSISLFWKIFLPDGKTTNTRELVRINTIPKAYASPDREDPREKEIWSSIWDYAVDPDLSGNVILSNVTLKSGDRIFIPGTLFELKIDGTGKLDQSSVFLPDKN